MAKKQVFLFLILIMAVASFFRLWEIKTIPPGFSYDEAMYANNAVEAWETGHFKLFYTENNGREGLWINMLAPVLATFEENQPWVSRTLAAIFGILTVLGLYFLAKVLFHSERIALLSSFFMAASFWHINFSRIGFRAILVPFFLVWSFYFLWKVISSQRLSLCYTKAKPLFFVMLAGSLLGLGFHTYISFRVAPLLLIIPFILIWRKQKKLILIFLFFTFITALPIGLYFLQNPQDFLSRSSQVSIFAGHPPVGGPAFALGVNIIKTVGMFFVWGDNNWRHNLSGAPELWWPVAVLFLIGIWQIVKRGEAIFLLLWLVVLLIPAVMSNEGMPHALRSIGVIPAVMILSAIGLEWIIVKVLNWHSSLEVRLRISKSDFEKRSRQLIRIKKQLIALLFVFLVAIAVNSFNQYFFRWAGNPRVADAFDENYVQLGRYLNSLPKNLPKYIFMNCRDNMFCDNPDQPPVIMFITKTYIPAWRAQNNIFYINPSQIDSFVDEANKKERLVITMLNVDPFLRTYLKEKIPNLNIASSQSFGIISFYK